MRHERPLGARRCNDDIGPLWWVNGGRGGWGVSSLPFAVQDSPPVVRPRLESSLGWAGGEVLVVAGGEQDVLPCWFSFHTWKGGKHYVSANLCVLRCIKHRTYYLRHPRSSALTDAQSTQSCVKRCKWDTEEDVITTSWYYTNRIMQFFFFSPAFFSSFCHFMHVERCVLERYLHSAYIT